MASGKKKVSISEFSEEAKAHMRNLNLPDADFVMAGDMKYVIPRRLDIDYIKFEMPVYEDDIFIVTPPKCGTTWTQEIVWLLLNNMAKPTNNQFYRVPFLEIGSIRALDPELKCPTEDMERNEENLKCFQTFSVDYVKNMKRPRIIKTHLPLSLLPENLLDKCKVIFVTRNIKDMAVSYYYHHQLKTKEYSFKEFAQGYKKGVILQTPMIPMTLEAWNKRHLPNLLFNTYEDMKKDFRSTVEKLAKFLDLSLTEETFQELEERVNIEAFRKDVLVNKSNEIPMKAGKSFIRKGVVGDWKNHFDEDMSKEWDVWIEGQTKGTADFKMVYEL